MVFLTFIIFEKYSLEVLFFAVLFDQIIPEVEALLILVVTLKFPCLVSFIFPLFLDVQQECFPFLKQPRHFLHQLED